MSKNPQSAVTSFGIYWERDAEWSPSKLYGRHLPDTINTKKHGVVNFATQHAVYLLPYEREIVYVGRTVELAERLKEYTQSPTLHNRWTRFSWFWFRQVIHDSNGGRLGEARLPSGFAMCDLMSVVESVLIEAVEPRNNRRGGAGFNDRAYGQVPLAEVEKMEGAAR